jgi:shikimate kinase
LLKAGDPREILGRLMAERHPIYAEADLVVDSPAGGAHDEVAAAIRAALAANGALEETP